MDMTMTYEHITPDLAAEYLKRNSVNRTLTKSTYVSYARDIVAGDWTEKTSNSISFDEDGRLVDGQHRLNAIVRAGRAVDMWVCRNVSSAGVYDNNRKRSASDQITIARPDFEPVYHSTRYISVATALIVATTEDHSARRVTAKEIARFTDAHKADLDEFFLNIPLSKVNHISIATVYTALFMAFMRGVPMGSILEFYDILASGMGASAVAFPVIAYRNYLMDKSRRIQPTLAELGRCQYALKHFLKEDCTKKTMCPKKLIWPFPWTE